MPGLNGGNRHTLLYKITYKGRYLHFVHFQQELPALAGLEIFLPRTSVQDFFGQCSLGSVELHERLCRVE